MKTILASMTLVSCVLSTNVFADDDFCSRLQSVKECAELGCNWLWEEQRCVDNLPVATPIFPYECRQISSPKICDSRVHCIWNGDVCRDRF